MESDSNWKKQIRQALGGHKLEVAFLMLWAEKRFDDLAELFDDGGTIINFGSLDSNVGTKGYSLASRQKQSPPENCVCQSPRHTSHQKITEAIEHYERGGKVLLDFN